jgi:TolB-like protein/DNA-binding winged helix-turn-helix (wHTH) protein/Tfp pilus assembly protein PilF
MTDPAGDIGPVRFGVFEANLRTGELRRDGRRVSLQEKPFQLLAALLERPGELVTREELRQRLWSADVFVDFEQGLSGAIKKLRTALDDSAENPRFVETLARRGYRFIAPVGAAPASLAPAAEQRARRFGGGWRLLLAALALAVGFGVLARLWLSRSVSAGRSTLLVLPFQNLSGDAEQEYVSDGMTEEMITQVGRLKPDRLAVIGPTSAMHYKGTTLRADEIGRELGVEYLLSGSVRRSGGQVRVTVALVRVKDQVLLWSDSYDRELKDVLGVQSSVAQAIAGAIPLALSADDRARLAVPRPVDPVAHEAYLEGLYFWNKFSPETVPKAIEHFQRAIDRDPGYAPAHAGLAYAYGTLAVFGISPAREAYPKSKAAAAKALQIDADQVDAHHALGWAAFIFDLDFPAAEREFTRAIALDSNSGEAYHGYGMYLAAMGRSDSSIAAIRRARELDPLSLHINHKLCAVLYWARQYDAAIAQCRRTLELEPRYGPAHWHLAHAYDAKGMHDEAQEEYFLAHEFIGGDVEQIRRDRAAVKVSGWRPILRQGAEGLSNALKGSRNPHEAEEMAYIVAWMWARLGETDPTLEWLEKSYAARDFFLPFIGVEPLFDPMRSHPRFQQLLRRIGLPQAQTSRPKT